MVKSDAKTVEEYLNQLTEERRSVVSSVRDVILNHLPDGYQESMNWGMISYEIPLDRYPDTYNGQPLSFASLAAQKNYFSLYLMCVYQETRLRTELEDAFREIGKKPDMGKSCIRFKKTEDIPLMRIGKLLEEITPEKLIKSYESVKKN